MKKEFVMLAGGDLILGANPEYYFQGIDRVLKDGDLVLTQLEVPYSDDAPELQDLNRERTNMEPLLSRFDLVTMAGNHIYDAGEKGVLDTLEWLDEKKMPHVGVGRNLEEAKKPLILEKEGIRFGFLNYNCVGGAAQFAGKDKAGGAPLPIITHYDLEQVANPGGAPEKIHTFPVWSALEDMVGQVRELKTVCDIVCVYFHKGLVHKPVKLADYEHVVSYAAIEAGADVVFGGHSHIMHGIEVYKGKTIYHGLSNLITWVPSLGPGWKRKSGKASDIFDPEAWAKTRMERFGFVPLMDYSTYPFHPESIYSMIAKCVIRDKTVVETRFIPLIVNREGVPEAVERENGGQEVLDYMEKITRDAGLNGRFCWDGDEIVIGADA